VAFPSADQIVSFKQFPEQRFDGCGVVLQVGVNCADKFSFGCPEACRKGRCFTEVFLE